MHALLFFYEWLTFVYVSAPCVRPVPTEARISVRYILDRELETIVSHCVGAGNRLRTLCLSNKPSVTEPWLLGSIVLYTLLAEVPQLTGSKAGAVASSPGSKSADLLVKRPAS